MAWSVNGPQKRLFNLLYMRLTDASGPPVPTLPYIDTFAGADANPIGSPYVPWLQPGSGSAFDNLQRLAGVCYGVTTPGRNVAYLSNFAMGPKHYAETTVGSLGATLGGLMAGPWVGVDPAAPLGWGLAIDDANTLWLNRFGPVFYQPLTTTGHIHTPGDVYRLAIDLTGPNPVLTGWANGVVVINNLVDLGALSSSAGTRCAILARNDDCQVTRFEMDNLP